MGKSVVVHFRGRLGNQLFEYYTALAVARRAGAEVYFDPHWENNPDILTLAKIVEASPALLDEVRGDPGIGGKLYRLAQRFRPERTRSFWLERAQEFDARLLKARSSCFLDGYWQSYKYFSDLGTAEFDPVRAQLSRLGQSDPWLEQARRAVLVHVRRTDYKGTFPILSLDYYLRAMNLFSGQQFLVVSDDPEECQQLFSGVSNAQVLTDGGRTLWLDLNLMVQAAGVIAANSTFSWWGAYLNARSGVKVVVPRQWFAREKGVEPDLDALFPPSWQRI